MPLPDRIVDAHHHLWDLSHCHYPWLMAKGVKRFFGDPAPIQKDYLPNDLKADFGALPVVKSVHIQVGVEEAHAVRETEWLQSMGDQSGYPTAIVAFTDLTASNLDAMLDDHGKNDRLRGVRQIVGRSAEEDRKTGTAGLLDDPAFLSGLKTLARRELSFDLQLTPPLMQRAADVLAQVEDLPVALCHAGSPSDFTMDGMEEWRTGLARLAELPNLICKLSGFGMFNHDWTSASIQPLLIEAIDLFGPARIAFGSNFPVDKLYAPYGKTMGAYGELTADFSSDERRQMFADSAERFYRI